jgi:hypothetical protein
VPNNIVRPTYLDLISNRFIATSLRLVSAEKFDLDPSAEKSYFGQTVWWIEHSPFFSAGTSCRLVAIKSHEIRSIYMSPAILLSPWLYVITYIFNKIRYELTARNRIEQLLIKKPSLRPNGHLD